MNPIVAYSKDPHVDGAGPGAVSWLRLDIDDDGQDEVVQCWDAGGKLGMTVYGIARDGSDRFEIRDSRIFQNAGPRAVAWLVGDMDGDEQDEIIQCWDNDGMLGITVYRWDGSGVAIAGTCTNVGMGSGAVAWLIGDINDDGRDEIIQCWNDGGDLGLIVYGDDGSGVIASRWHRTLPNAGPRAVKWLLGDVDGDRCAELVQCWDNDGQLGMTVFGSAGGYALEPRWNSPDLGEGPRAVAWLVGDVDGDGRDEVVQCWNNDGQLGMIVWGNQGGQAMSAQFASANMRQGHGAVAWLACDVDGDGRDEVVQCWNNDGRLSMIVYGTQLTNTMETLWSSTILGAGPGARVWLAGDFSRSGATEIFQGWDNDGTLGVTLYRQGRPLVVWSRSVDLDHIGTAIAWIRTDVDGDGLDELVQLWDDRGQLAMAVFELDSLGQLVRRCSQRLPVGPGGIAWLAADVDHDGRVEIVQLWDNGGRLGIFVYGFDPMTSAIQVRWSAADTGAGPGALEWLVADVDGDGHDEIVQCWDNGGKLSILLWHGDSSCALTPTNHDLAPEGSSAIRWLVADLDDDGRDEIVQCWRNGERLGIHVYGVDGDGSFGLLWGSRNVGEGPSAREFLVADVDGDGRDEVVQCWKNDTQLGMIVYKARHGCALESLWKRPNMRQGYGAFAWLVGDVDGDGRDEIVQCWDNDGKLGMIVYGSIPDQPLGLDLAWSDPDTGQPAGGRVWLAGHYLADGKAQIFTCRKNAITHHLDATLFRERPPRTHATATPAEKLRILQELAPQIHLHSAETYHPSSVEHAFAHMVRTLREGRFCIQTTLPLPGPQSVLPFLRGTSEVQTVPSYAFWVDKDPFVDLVYFLFYPYNEGKEILGTRWGNHVGDWEHVTVRLLWVRGPGGTSWVLEPRQVYLSAHDFGASYYARQVPTEGTHPIVYSARGSHGCWRDPGDHVYRREGALQLVDECDDTGAAWCTWSRLAAFDFSAKQALGADPWPQWMRADFSSPGQGDPEDPATGPIYRWGNDAQGCLPSILGVCQLEEGPQGPISKDVWHPDKLA